MKQIAEFVKTTLTGGLLVLLPILGCVYVVVKVLGLLTSLFEPLVSVLPVSRFAGIAMADAVSLLLLLLISFWVGLFTKTRAGKSLGGKISKVLHLIPGYTIIWRVVQIFFNDDETNGIPVVVQRGDGKRLGFLMEENGEGEATVFFPSSPTPLSGDVVVVSCATVERLNVPATEVARIVATFGLGAAELLQRNGGSTAGNTGRPDSQS